MSAKPSANRSFFAELQRRHVYKVGATYCVGGDVITLTGPWVYPDLVERHFDQALQSWSVAPEGTRKQQVEKLKARTAIMMMAGRRQEMQADCASLKGLLEQDAAANPDEPAVLTGLSWAELCLGHNADAMRAARHATELLPLQNDAYFGAYYLNGLAQTAAWAGQPDEALRLIEQLLSIPSGDFMMIGRLRLDPVWDPLRQDPRFQKLIADYAVNKGHP